MREGDCFQELADYDDLEDDKDYDVVVRVRRARRIKLRKCQRRHRTVPTCTARNRPCDCPGTQIVIPNYCVKIGGRCVCGRKICSAVFDKFSG